jgi:hypothetical protein
MNPWIVPVRPVGTGRRLYWNSGVRHVSGAAGDGEAGVHLEVVVGLVLIAARESTPGESGRGLPHSKTLRDGPGRWESGRSWSAPALWRFARELGWNSGVMQLGVVGKR